VKTRLADDVGPSAAAEIYWQMGLKIVAATVGSGHRTVVWFSPAEEATYVREWLDGVARLEFRLQVGLNLGARLIHAFGCHFADGAGRVVIIGTDCPGVDRRLINQAFTALGEHDVVIGTALDGGYYLIGLAAPQPALFRSIPWSTPAVAAQTRTRAHALGLSCHLLRPLRDVDTARDARALGLLPPGL
jgi:rSAM/selenodomain-associated transferase 1